MFKYLENKLIDLLVWTLLTVGSIFFISLVLGVVYILSGNELSLMR